MLNKIIILLFSILTFNTLGCFANEYQQIDLKTAIDLALQNNLDIKSSKMDVDIAKNEIKISNRLQNPSIITVWNFGKSGKGNQNQIGLAQTIELFKRGPRKNLAKVNYELSSENFEYQKFNLKMDITEAYLKLIVAKAILKKYEHQQKFLEDLLRITNKNNRKNNNLDLDTLEAKLALNQIITEVNREKTDTKTAIIEFNRVINSLDGHYDAIEYDLPLDKKSIGINIPLVTEKIPPLSEIKESAMNNRYDIKIAKNEILLAKKKLSVVTHQRIPDVEVAGGYGYQTIGLSDDDTYKPGAFLGANLANVPLLYSYRPEIQNAKMEVEKANLNYISTINKAKKSIEIAYDRFVNAQLNMERYNDKILKESEELFALFEKKYSVEKVDFATLAAVEETYEDFISGYAEALSDYYTSWINLLREMNYEDFFVNNQSL